MVARVVKVGLVLAVAAVGWVVPADAVHSDDGSDRRIAFARFDPDIGGPALWTVLSDGTDERRLTPGQAYFPDWSPDRSSLLFDFPDDDGNEQIAQVKADGSGFKQLTDMTGVSECADYSPDGKRIVFDRYTPRPGQPFHTSLWVMRADGTHPHPLFGARSKTFDVEPEYSPDGSRIAFGRIKTVNGSEVQALWVADADGSHRHRITPYSAGVEHPSWAPDGRRVMYDVEAGTPRDGLYLVSQWGRGLHRFFHRNTVVAFKPDFSPNGKRILFGCFIVAEQQEDLCVMSADGQHLHRVVRTADAFENWPTWS